MQFSFDAEWLVWMSEHEVNAALNHKPLKATQTFERNRQETIFWQEVFDLWLTGDL